MSIQLVDLYKKAWETHSLEYLTLIFHDEIRYQEHCNNVIIGLDNLKEYWQKNAKKQSNVVFSPIKYIEDENELVIFWEASFFELHKKKTVELQGIMWLKIVKGKIVDLIEFFEQKY